MSHLPAAGPLVCMSEAAETIVAAPAETGRCPAVRPLRVLLVDDDEPLRRVLRLGLERHGFAVIEAEDGNRALAQIGGEAFDWVVTDIVMPDCEGIELLRLLRLRCPRTRVIAMSGGGLGDADGYLQIARLLGASHVLKKPFVYTELVQLIDPTP